MAKKIVTLPLLRSEYGVTWSRQHIGRLEREGKFPKRVQIGANSVGWLASELDAWVEAKAAERAA